MKILVVDDDPISRTVMERGLEKAGYGVLSAADAAAALAALEEDPSIGLVVTDIVMPDMDGLRLVERLRAVPRFGGLPVLVCSAVAQRERVLEAGRLNVAGYMLKPVDIRRLRAEVARVIGEAAAALGEPGHVMRRLDLDLDAYLAMVGTFLDQALALGAELHAEGGEGDRQAWRVRAAALAGAAQTLGLERLHELLDEQGTAPQGASFDPPATLSALEREVGRARIALVGMRRIGPSRTFTAEPRDRAAAARS